MRNRFFSVEQLESRLALDAAAAVLPLEVHEITCAVEVAAEHSAALVAAAQGVHEKVPVGPEGGLPAAASDVAHERLALLKERLDKVRGLGQRQEGVPVGPPHDVPRGDGNGPPHDVPRGDGPPDGVPVGPPEDVPRGEGDGRPDDVPRGEGGGRPDDVPRGEGDGRPDDVPRGNGPPDDVPRGEGGGRPDDVPRGEGDGRPDDVPRGNGPPDDVPRGDGEGRPDDVPRGNGPPDTVPVGPEGGLPDNASDVARERLAELRERLSGARGAARGRR